MSTRIFAVLLTAQDEEVQPILDILTTRALKPVKQNTAVGEAWLGASTRGSVLVVKTGVGLVQTACTLSWVLSAYTPQVVISTGAAGGLGKDIKVGDIVVGDRYMYTNADGTAFGYTFGQVPGQPEFFKGDANALSVVPEEAKVGLMLSSDSFVTATTLPDTPKRFPGVLSTDMESTAAAQVCANWGIPFVSVRCISDLCSIDSAKVYSEHLDNAGVTSARVAIEMLDQLTHSRGTQNQRFSHDSLTAALLLVFSVANDLTSGDPETVPDSLREAVEAQAGDDKQKFVKPVLERIAAAQAAIAADSSMTLTASQYEKSRKYMINASGVKTERGSLVWPPTSQTIIKRFGGYWNDALSSIGLNVLSGRKRGGLRFTEKSYISALRSFAAWCARNSVSPSYKAYTQWVAKTDKKGKVPSGAAIRQRYGSWSEATKTARI
ncbi:MAG: 5'-methylthioadenosine/S-adenosylhomocysteine nucleosidase [Actinomycetaceae bacterium]|nr:5'-methylthioadenosine/S-adenosylhomocysteine nucleosidase [Actinomycetaceae bacterium]